MLRSILKKTFLNILTNVLSRYNYGIIRIDNHYPITKPIKTHSVEILSDDAFQASVRETQTITLLDTARLANLWSLCKLTDAAGAILEIGTYKGGGALHLSNAAPKRHIIVCDPFSPESFKELDPIIDSKFAKGAFKNVSSEAVAQLFQSKLRSYEVIVGYFPDSVRDKVLPQISFVHLDADVYEATYSSLEFVLRSSLLMERTLIVLDDYYREVEGVKKAVDDILKIHSDWMVLPLFPAQGILIPKTWFESQ
jgi:predicted O-methyltransferase YrrM